MSKPVGFPTGWSLRSGDDLLGVGHRAVKVYVEIGIIRRDMKAYGDVLDIFRHVYRHFYRLDISGVCTSIYEFYNVRDVVGLVICHPIVYYRAGCVVTEIRHFGDVMDAILCHLEYSRCVGHVTLNGDVRGDDSR